jgi:hypothetical protein
VYIIQLLLSQSLIFSFSFPFVSNFLYPSGLFFLCVRVCLCVWKFIEHFITLRVGRWGRDEYDVAMCVNSDINFRRFAVPRYIRTVLQFVFIVGEMKRVRQNEKFITPGELMKERRTDDRIMMNARISHWGENARVVIVRMNAESFLWRRERFLTSRMMELTIYCILARIVTLCRGER